MAVLDSVPNELNTCSSARPYGCFNRTMKDGYYLKVREYNIAGTYLMVDKFIPHTMSTECRFDRSLTDPRCADCVHRGSGEAYDAAIRAAGK